MGAAYAAVIGDVRILAEQHKKVQRRHDQSQPYSADNDLDVYKLSAQLSVINKNNIGSIGEVEGNISRLKAEYEKQRVGINDLIEQHNRNISLMEQAQTFFELSAKSELSEAEKLKLSICKSNGILTREDYELLRERTVVLSKKIAALKDQLDNCRQQYDVYRDISDTYNRISKSDYISNLVDEERKRQEQMKKKKRRR